MFGDQEFDVLGEIYIGKKGTNLRLVATKSGKKRIESWSNMSKRWNVMYRYDVDAAWAGWKRLEASIKPKPKPKTTRKKVEKKEPAKTKATKTTTKPTRKLRKKKDD